ncbi:hypothetical protein CKAH01_06838 [Colletotrichum kahawae]|uniref:Uncharacterized protein n=1 Tax=Colletotrichum kahawae TaxID=34407 RepID=A0AAE0D4S1_COLKA|nr:hypothetical protein CKAH01_06838 [Colletotrichum kahawae]
MFLREKGKFTKVDCMAPWWGSLLVFHDWDRRGVQRVFRIVPRWALHSTAQHSTAQHSTAQHTASTSFWRRLISSRSGIHAIEDVDMVLSGLALSGSAL